MAQASFTFVSLHDQPFSRYRFFENRKYTEWPQNDLKHLSVKSTLCTLNTHPRGPNFTPFRSTTSRFQDTRLKIGNAPNDPRMTLQFTINKYNHLQVHALLLLGRAAGLCKQGMAGWICKLFTGRRSRNSQYIARKVTVGMGNTTDNVVSKSWRQNIFIAFSSKLSW